MMNKILRGGAREVNCARCPLNETSEQGGQRHLTSKLKGGWLI